MNLNDGVNKFYKVFFPMAVSQCPANVNFIFIIVHWLWKLMHLFFYLFQLTENAHQYSNCRLQRLILNLFWTSNLQEIKSESSAKLSRQRKYMCSKFDVLQGRWHIESHSIFPKPRRVETQLRKIARGINPFVCSENICKSETVHFGLQ